jgi:hypothetical protein
MYYNSIPGYAGPPAGNPYPPPPAAQVPVQNGQVLIPPGQLAVSINVSVSVTVGCTAAACSTCAACLFASIGYWQTQDDGSTVFTYWGGNYDPTANPMCGDCVPVVTQACGQTTTFLVFSGNISVRPLPAGTEDNEFIIDISCGYPNSTTGLCDSKSRKNTRLRTYPGWGVAPGIQTAVAPPGTGC